MRGARRKIGALAIAIAVLAACASLADAELSARGDLFVRFSGGISPNALPRNARAPISVHIAGTIRTLSGQRPPALRGISIAINRGGRLDTQGLPVCTEAQIEPSTTRDALETCGPALVGRGSYSAVVAFPEQATFTSAGRILAFNAVIDGQHAILAHVYGAQPIPITRVIVFHIHHASGSFGTILTGFLPASTNRYGYVTRIGLSLHRDFVLHGRPRSYLSAACEAPSGFPGAVFPFARASMTFADGRSLASTLTRSCKVRGA